MSDPAAPLCILIADDEPLALELLRALLARIPQVQVVGEAVNGDEVLTQSARLKPDALILDINMPGRSGLEAALALWRPGRPELIFLTAHAHHAVNAFELDAADYLLKPVGLQRLADALSRARSRRSGGAPEDRVVAPAGSSAPGRRAVIPVSIENR